jgi:molybdopterin/thiamine biosynthesis adenylyltransferase
MVMTINRYGRQTLVKDFGLKGQEILATKHAVVIGGGGLGSHSASLLVRMGIGSIDIVDNDIVDITNLHRTAVFSEQDVGKSKALILQEKLQAVNTNVRVKGINEKVTSENIESLIEKADVIIDGTDSIPLRLLINETSIQYHIPWIYAGVYETIGMVMGIIPGKTPCFQCITQTIPTSSPGEIPVLGSLPATIASIQCNETVKLLLDKPLTGLILYDVWKQCFEVIDIQRNPHCLICGGKKA